ncbi:MAG: hypothetical protein DCF12_08260 [Snowella sp.]|nr:MAG: hypothetical protein DCF12_08260 [Snowella sp.]
MKNQCYSIFFSFSKIIFCLFIIALINVVSEIAIAEAVTMNFQWTGEKGYSAKIVFSYHEPLNSDQIIEEGRGKAKIIENLTVSFYNPAGQSLGSYDNIKQGVSQFPYFKFNFNPQKQQVTGLIDLGGASLGEIYLKGIVQENLKLFKIDQSGQETIYDQKADFRGQDAS